MTSRFALLRHEVPDDFGRASHWDLLLEHGDVCWTWALDTLPAGLTAAVGPAAVEARRLADHRQHYLDYQGPVSDNRGRVTRVQAGECLWHEASDSTVRVQLTSAAGALELSLVSVDADRWQLTIE